MTAPPWRAAKLWRRWLRSSPVFWTENTTNTATTTTTTSMQRSMNRAGKKSPPRRGRGAAGRASRRAQPYPPHPPPPPPSSPPAPGGSSPSSGSEHEDPHAPPSSSSSSSCTRRPIRPVDREKMLPWLRQKLDSQEMPNNLWWVEPGRVFAVKWPHAARHGFSSQEDARLFKAWAEHTGRHTVDDPEDHKRWKSNFRCAIHSLPEVDEVQRKDGRKGPKAKRVYTILEEPKPKKKSKKCRSQVEVSEEESRGEDSDSGVSAVMDSSLPLTVLEVQPQTENLNEEEKASLPNFKRLGLIRPKHHSGGCMTIKEKPPFPSTQQHPPINTSHYFSPSSSSSSSPFSSSFPSTTITTTTTTAPPTPADLLTFIANLSTNSYSLRPTCPATITTLTPTTVLSCLEKQQHQKEEEEEEEEDQEDEEEVDMEDMLAVGIKIEGSCVTVDSRERSPSGDSGISGSPQAFEERGNEEGIIFEIVDNIPSSEGENVQFAGETFILDISQSVPEPAVAMEVHGQDDYTYTCLDGVDLQFLKNVVMDMK
ncbi:uncharacterized protein LOC143293026 isoform X2 [Babylonia areolata]|uniref:uncharacterized protein LOC143293026 isoform X2 n=1 Tax=Babylonia areolata TaxID=304850 RepID=UPI003FD631E5